MIHAGRSERCKANYAACVRVIMSQFLEFALREKSVSSIWPSYERRSCDGTERINLTNDHLRRYYINRYGGPLHKEVFMSKRQNPKTEALQHTGTLNPHPERVRDKLFAENEFFDPRDLLQVKYEMLRRRQVEGEAVTAVAAAFGFSRPSVYHALRAFEQEGLFGLVPQRRGPKQAHKLTGPVVAFIEDALRSGESLSMMDLAPMVEEEFGIRVHRRSIERALARQRKKGR